MTRQVKLMMREDVAVIALAGQATDARDLASGFDSGMRAALAGALEVALTDRAVKAVLLRAGAAGWPCALPDPAGDYSAHPAAPDLAQITRRIATAPKPVVAALSGRIVGGALALSQAAGWRIAQAGTEFEAVEPRLGYLPAAGGLVELSRRLGAGTALAYVLGGRAMGAQEALKIGLIDEIGGDAARDGLALAQVLARGAPAPRRHAPEAGLADPAAYIAAIAQARADLALPEAAQGTEMVGERRIGQGLPIRAAQKIVDVVEAGLLLPETGLLDFEAVALADLLATPATKALRYQAAARQRAERLAGIELEQEDIGSGGDAGHVGLWFGAAGQGDLIGAPDGGQDGSWAVIALGRLAWRLSTAGPVRLGAASQTDLEALFAVVARAHAAAVERGDLSPEAGDAAWARIEPVVSLKDLAAVGWVVASAPQSQGAAGRRQLEDLAVALKDVPRFVLAGAPRPPQDQTEQDSPQRAPQGHGWGLLRIGAQIAELVPTAEQHAALTPICARLQSAGLIVLHGGEAPDECEPWQGGGIAQRMQARLILAAERLAISAADPARIDRVLQTAGFGEGPFQRLDRAGRTASLALLQGAGRHAGILISEWTGGFYAPANGDGAADLPAEGLEDALALLREGRVQLRLSDGQIVARVVAELADEGAALLREGGAHRPCDIDLVMAQECGMRPEIGGPMHMADGIGLLTLRTQLRGMLAEGAPAPDPFWDVLIKNGTKFADLDGAP